MHLPFKKENIFVMAVGILLIALGYILMATEDFIDAEKFSLALYVSPPLIIIGHVVIIFGIVARLGKKAEDANGEVSEASTSKA